MALQLHFKLEGNYPDTDAPTPKIMKDSLKYLNDENSRSDNIHSLAPDILFNLRQEFPGTRWVNDVYHVCSFYGQDRKDCIANLKLRRRSYEEYEYYFFIIGALDGKYFCLEFKCVSEDIFSDSDSIFMEIDL